jgi:LmbE family N-acetylglucosaminyl deacetylase
MHLFLSPHPDDAPLSCGGLIHQLTAAGQEVVIVTTMGGDPPAAPPDTPLVRELHARWGLGAQPSVTRRAEDEAAGRVLGAQVIFLPLPDCIYRTDSAGAALYPTGDDLFDMVHPDDPAQDVERADRWLRKLLRDTTDLYLPLAVGDHVDHQIVRDWGAGFSIIYPRLKLWFYEDYPYSADPLARDGATGGLPFTVLRRSVIGLSASDVRAKIESIQCYASQLSTFWPDWGAMAEQVTGFMTTGGTRPAREIYWTGEM